MSVLNVGQHPFTEYWDGVLYKALADYPAVQDHELRAMLDFIAYEKAHGRTVEVVADTPALLEQLRQRLRHPGQAVHAPLPPVLRECTACTARGGCMTDLVCHTAPPEAAAQILRDGALLCAERARHCPAEQLAQEPRNAAHDPPDTFRYVLFSWGNCQAGDRLVMERRLGRPPTEAELAPGFIPGVRFYARRESLERHPGVTHDGFLPLRIEGAVSLAEWISLIVIPAMHALALCGLTPPALQSRVHILSGDGMDVWQWAEHVYAFAHAKVSQQRG